jgi:hypothetical protein
MPSVRVTITIDGDDTTATASLFDWLRRDQALTRYGRVNVSTRDAGGAMGALEVVDVTLTHATGIATLWLAFSAWRHSRRSAPHARFEVGGVEILAKDDAPETLAALERAVHATLPPPAQHQPDVGGPA